MREASFQDCACEHAKQSELTWTSALLNIFNTTRTGVARTEQAT